MYIILIFVHFSSLCGNHSLFPGSTRIVVAANCEGADVPLDCYNTVFKDGLGS